MPKTGRWIETTAEHDQTLQGQIEELQTLRTLPPSSAPHASRLQPANARQQQQQGQQVAGEDAAAACLFPSSPTLLKAFRPAYEGEPASSIEDRMRTMEATWAEFEGRVKDQQRSLEMECFDSMDEFKKSKMLEQRQNHAGRVPSIILSSKGMVTGDRLDTYKLLKSHLEDERGMNAYAVMLEPSHLQHGAGAAVSEMLWQLARVAGPENMEALHQWYEDQTADPSLPAHNNEAAPADQAEGGATAAAGAMRNSEGAPAAAEAQAGSSGVAGPSAAAVDERDAGEAGTSAGEADASAIVGAGNAGASMSAAAAEDAAANKKGPRGAKHTLRERKVAQPQSKGQSMLAARQAKAAANRERPLVVVVRNAEEVNSCVLWDLLCLLLLDYARFPACLVLGCCKPAHEYLSNLPISCLNRMDRKSYDLSNIEDRLTALFRELLTSPTALVLPSERVLRGLMQQYQQFEGDVTALLQSMHVMHVLHHSTQPLASLAQVVMEAAINLDYELEAAAAAAGAIEANRVAELPSLSASIEQAVSKLPGQMVAAMARALEGGGAPAAARNGSAASKGAAFHTNNNGNKAVANGGAAHTSNGKAGTSGRGSGVSGEAAHANTNGKADANGKGSKGGQKRGQLPVQEGGEEEREANGKGSKEGQQKRRRQGDEEGRGTEGEGEREGGTAKKKSRGGAGSTQTAQHDVAAVTAAVVQARHAHARWCLGVQWVNQIAELTGAVQDRPDYTIPILYLNACSRSFAGQGGRHFTLEEMLSDLCGPISRVSIHHLQQQDLMQLQDVLDSCARIAQEERLFPEVDQLLQGLTTALEEPKPTPQQQHQQQQGQQGQQQQPRSGAEEAREQQDRPSGSAPTAAAAAQTPAGAAATAAKPAVPPAAAAKKSTVPQGKKGRDALLKEATLAQASTKAPPPSTKSAAATATPKRTTPGSRFAAWCAKALRSLLGVNPFCLPGSVVFTFDDPAALEGLGLHAEPRAALHNALVRPSSYLGEGVVDDANPMSTDVEILYQRLLGHQDTCAVKSWFDDYCEVAMREGVGEQENDEEVPGSAQNKRKGSKGAAAAPKPQAKRHKAAAAGTSEAGPSSAGKEEANDESRMEERAMRYAACFSQAAAELEHMGVVRPSRRKKGQNVTRAFEPPEAAPAEFGLEDAYAL